MKRDAYTAANICLHDCLHDW